MKVLRCDNVECGKETDEGELMNPFGSWMTLAEHPQTYDKHFCGYNCLTAYLVMTNATISAARAARESAA